MKNWPSQPTRIEDYRSSGSQFTLRGLFFGMTAVCVILALLALAIRQPLHWLGALAVPLICLAIIAVLELVRRLFPPRPRFQNHFAPRPYASQPHNLLPTQRDEASSPFAPRQNQFSTDPGNSPFAGTTPPTANEMRPDDWERPSDDDR